MFVYKGATSHCCTVNQTWHVVKVLSINTWLCKVSKWNLKEQDVHVILPVSPKDTYSAVTPRLKERIVINVDRDRTSQESIAEMNIRGTANVSSLTLCILS